MNPIEFFQKAARYFKGYSENCGNNYITLDMFITVSGKTYHIENIGLNNLINRRLSIRFEGGTAFVITFDENFNFEFASDFEATKAREWVFKDEKLTANDVVRMAVAAVQFELQVFRSYINSLIQSEVEI